MRVIYFVLSVVFLGVVPPVFLIAIATPWPFVNILGAWTVLVLISLPLLWLVLKRKPAES